MADIENQPEVILPAKRKPDVSCQDQENVPIKTQKLQAFDEASEQKHDIDEEEKNRNKIHVVDSSTEEKIINNSANSEEKFDEAKEKAANDKGADYEEENDDAGDDGDDDDDDDDDSDEESSEEAEVDRKGKGIMRDDKGKGKLIEEGDSDSDDSSDEGNESEADSDLSDDPLAEVNLDNILPSRTRRRVVQPGFYIARDLGNDGDDDGDDSDA